jgi:hypothetical protein
MRPHLVVSGAEGDLVLVTTAVPLQQNRTRQGLGRHCGSSVQVWTSTDDGSGGRLRTVTDDGSGDCLRMATDDDSGSQMRRATSDGSGDGCGRRQAAAVAAARFREEQRCEILRVLCGFLILSAGFSRSQILGHQSLAAGPHGPQMMFFAGRVCGFV